MSRTYRKIPHWASEECLNDEMATVEFSSERGANWHGMKNGVSPANGNVIGFEDDTKRSRAARLHTNKIRRAIDRKEITEGISEMVDGAQEAMAELAAMDADLYDNIDEAHWLTWDEYIGSDPIEEEPIDDYDPYWDMDYDYDY